MHTTLVIIDDAGTVPGTREPAGYPGSRITALGPGIYWYQVTVKLPVLGVEKNLVNIRIILPGSATVPRPGYRKA